MKRAIACIALASACAAHADTITLGLTGGAGALEQFYNVPNDAAISPLNIVISPQYQYATYLTLGALTCNNVVNPPWGPGSAGGAMTCADGSHPTIQMDITSTRVCNHSGRGQSCHSLYTLLDGTITR